MAKYDLIVISNPELSKNATKELIEEITSKIKNTNGQISSHQSLGVKKFASPVKKNGQKFLEGIYDSISFEQESNEIQSFTSELRFNQSILKFRIVHSKEFEWEKLNQVPDQENSEAVTKDTTLNATEKNLKETSEAETKDATPNATEKNLKETSEAETKDATLNATEKNLKETSEAETKDAIPNATEKNLKENKDE